MSKRILLLGSFLALFLTAASGQQFHRYTLNAGGGPGINRAQINSFLSNSYHFSGGAAYNLNRLFSLQAEYMYYNMPFQSAITQPPQGFPGAKAHVQSGTLNVIFNVPLKGKWGVYGIGGYGLYQRAVSADKTTLLLGTVCQPAYVFWNVTCVNGVVNPEQTISTRDTGAGGYNYGGGFTRRLYGPRLKFYGEVRYHRTNNRDIRTTILPITFGIRW